MTADVVQTFTAVKDQSGDCLCSLQTFTAVRDQSGDCQCQSRQRLPILCRLSLLSDQSGDCQCCADFHCSQIRALLPVLCKLSLQSEIRAVIASVVQTFTAVRD